MSEPVYFTTVMDMRGVPAEKIDAFIEDLRLWLHMLKQVEEIQRDLGPSVMLRHKTPGDAFGWIDDGKHDAQIKIEVSGQEWLPIPAPPQET